MLEGKRISLNHGIDTAAKSRAGAHRKRRRVFAKANYCCHLCGIHDPTYGERLVAHHIVPVDVGGHGGMSNLVTLCRSCHFYIHELSKRWIDDETVGQKIWDGITDKLAAKRAFKLASLQAWFDGKKLHLYEPGEVLRQVTSGAMITITQT